MILWRNVKLSIFIILIPTPDFPHFHYMLGGNLGSLFYGDVSVMVCLAEAHNRTGGVGGGGGRRTGLVVRASDSGSGDPGSILGRVGVLFP